MDIGLFRVLEDFQSIQTRMDPSLFMTAILAALVASFAASAMYRFFYESRGTGSQVHRAFPLLGISITTLFIGIQTSIPLSLGLLGALSIIRFRTPIKEPEEIGFIMLVVAASISAATFNFRYIVILYALALMSLFLIRGVRTFKFLKRDGVLVMTLADSDALNSKEGISKYLQENMRRNSLESSSSRDGVTSMQWTFSGLKSDVADFQAGLRKVAPVQSMNVFLDRPGGIR
ncbi:DUF4956 domain-containing protein [Desulfonatronum thiodismutans]|uniref:DUF4956 domain-containing protein n=1 Tax=Desulfonatronum thiodismutans TaxID=159290 RepID=UPI000A01C728|nr:DUF4956 domain-containing protein [Desulfonatronum thiodismutans]